MKEKLIFGFVLALLAIPMGLAVDYNVEAGLVPSSQSVCPCNAAIYTLTVENVGEDADVYTLSASSEWMTLSTEELSLDAGASEDVYVFITPVCSAEAGDYDFSVEINGEADVTAAGTLTIEVCHALEVSVLSPRIGCAGEEKIISVDVENSGTYDEEVVLSVSGDVADWIELQETEFPLASGEAKTVEAVVTLPADAESTSHSFFVDVASATSYAQASTEIVLDAENCYKVSVSPIPMVSTCTAGEESFSIVVKNLGEKEDTYVVSVIGIDKGLLEYAESVTVAAKDFETVDVTLTAPQEAGTYALMVDVASEQAGDTTEFELEVEACYGVVLSVDEPRTTCPSQPQTYILVMDSTGREAETYELSFEGIPEDWVEVVEGTVELEAFDTRFTEFTVTVPRDTEAGEHVILVKAQSMHVAEYAETGITVTDISECFGVDIELDAYEMDTEVGRGKLVRMSIKNTGMEDDVFDLTVSDSNWMFIRPERVAVPGGESKEVVFYVSPPYETVTGSYDFVLGAASQNTGVEKTITVNVEGVFETEPVTTVETTTEPVVEEEVTTESIEEEEVTTIEEEEPEETTTVEEVEEEVEETTTEPVEEEETTEEEETEEEEIQPLIQEITGKIVETVKNLPQGLLMLGVLIVALIGGLFVVIYK